MAPGPAVNPVPAHVLSGDGPSSISSGFDHTCGLREDDGAVSCWGFNGAGQLEDGTRVNRDSAVLSGLGMPSLVSVESGGDWSCGLSPEARIYCWGDVLTRWGHLLHGRDAPELVTGLPVMSSVSVGEYFACGVSDDGWIYCWGTNGLGQLGHGPDTENLLSWFDPAPVSAPR